jgi:hypothetical protein
VNLIDDVVYSSKRILQGIEILVKQGFNKYNKNNYDILRHSPA